MFLLFYLIGKCLPRCDVSYPGGWVWLRNVTMTFLVATWVWMPPLSPYYFMKKYSETLKIHKLNKYMNKENKRLCSFDTK